MDFSFRDLIEWSNTAEGIFVLRVFLVFLIAEVFGRGLSYKVMVFFPMDKKRENVIIDLSGYLVNIIAGIAMAFLLHENGNVKHSVLDGLWFIFGSMGLHFFYAKYFDKWLKNKARGMK